MRRLSAIAVLLAAFLLPPASQAQFRGGRGMGMPVTRAPGPVRGPMPGGFRPPMAGRFPGRIGVGGSFVRPAFVGRRFGFHSRFFFGGRCAFHPFFCRNFFFAGYPYAYPYYPYSYAYPYSYGYPYAAMTYDAQQPQYAADNSYQQGVEQGRLEEEVSGLRDQVSRLTDELARSRNAAPPEKAESAPLTTILVYRDGRHREITDYAISGPTLWILNAQTAVKVPLSQLDLDATHRVNDERGVGFPLP